MVPQTLARLLYKGELEEKESMSTNVFVTGVGEANEDFIKMKAVYTACIKADIEIPEEVEEFFDGDDPENLVGSPINIEKFSKGDAETEEGMLIDVQALPEYVRYIRVYMG